MMDLDKCRVIAVQGDINSGKSNVAVHLLRSYKGTKKIYLLGYPKKIDDFIPLTNRNQLGEVEDGIIFIDELQRFFRLYDKNTSREFIELVSLFAHKNNCLVFTTPLSQNITKTMESFVDGFCITRIKDITTLKSGSRIKKVIDNCADIRKTPWGLFLKNGEYLSSSEYDSLGEGGIVTFPFQGIGKDWRSTITHEVTHEVTHEISLPTNSPTELQTTQHNTTQQLTIQEMDNTTQHNTTINNDK